MADQILTQTEPLELSKLEQSMFEAALVHVYKDGLSDTHLNSKIIGQFLRGALEQYINSKLEHDYYVVLLGRLNEWLEAAV